MNADPMRYDFLDWLRVIAIFVLLFFHTGMLFVGWGWHIENEETIAMLAAPMDIAHRLRMPLLFVVSGAGLWFALRRRSGGQLLKERSLRLLLPLIAGMFLIVSPQVYFERLFRGQWDGGYFDFFVQRVLTLTPYPQGDFSWHHLWFIAYLYVYVILLLPLMLWLHRRQLQLKPGLWLFALGLPLAVNEAVLKPLFPEAHTLLNDWYTFNHYLMLTLFGFVLASMSGSWDWLAARRRSSLALAVGALTLAFAGFESGVIQRDTSADALIANVFTWLALLAFLGYGRRYLSFSNSLLRWSREASYPIYILHQTVIIACGYYIIQQPWAPWTKYAAVLVLTLASCALLYEVLIRRFALTRLLFGLKTSRSPAPRRVSPQATTV